MGMHSRHPTRLQRAQPQGPDSQTCIAVLDELLGCPVGKSKVLDEHAFRMSGTVEGFVQHPRVQEVVQEPTGPVVEGDEALEVGEGCLADPEAAAVVAEEVFGEGNEFAPGRSGGRVRLDFGLGVQVEPGVRGSAETLDWETGFI
jgi:hypothetical protein